MFHVGTLFRRVLLLFAICTAVTASACAARNTPEKPTAKNNTNSSKLRSITISPEHAPSEGEVSALHSAIQKHDSWDMIDYDEVLGGGYFYDGVGSYLLLIERGVLERSISELHVQTGEPGFEELLNYIESGFSSEECFGRWEILGKRDVRGHMGPAENVGNESLFRDAVASALLSGDVFLLEKEEGSVLDRVYMEHWRLRGDVGGLLFVDAENRTVFMTLSSGFGGI
jgi:hypothetical protein